MQTCVECVPQGEVFATLRELFESAPAQVEIARALGLVQYALNGYVDLVSGPSARIEHHRTGHVAIGATRAISRNQTKGIHRAHKTVHFHLPLLPVVDESVISQMAERSRQVDADSRARLNAPTWLDQSKKVKTEEVVKN